MEIIEWLNNLALVIGQAKCKIKGNVASLPEGLQTIAQLLENARTEGSRVWWVGNGGSSALCTHLAQDVLHKLKVPSLSLNDSSMLTCSANDFGYEEVYAKPLRTLAQSGDLLMAVSSGGRSENILRCVNEGLTRGMKVVSLSGFEETNPLYSIPVEVAVHLASHSYGHVEIGHEALLHAVLECLALKFKD